MTRGNRQLGFDWKYLERKGHIADAVLPAGESVDGTGVRPAVMKAVLNAINEHLGNNADAWPSQTTIAEIGGFSKRTALRAVQALTRLGLLIVVPEPRANGGHRNHYRIVWSELVLLDPERRRQFNSIVRPQSPQSHGDVGGDHGDVTTGHGDVASGHGDVTAPCMVTSRHPNYSPLTTQRTTQENTHHHKPRRASPGESVPDGWQVVVVILKRLDVSAWSKAVRTAIARGLDPSDVMALAEEFERLRARNSEATPGWLFRWITGESLPPSSERDAEQPAKVHAGSGLMSQTTEIETIRANAVIAGRQAGASAEDIERVIRERLSSRGFNPDELPEEVFQV